MKHLLGLRGRIFLGSLALILAVGLASGMYLEHRLRGWLELRVESELLHHAAVGSDLLGQLASRRRSASELDEIADRLGRATGTRVTVVGVSGRVLGDSALAVEEVRALEDHSDRPEIRAAIASGQGRSRRYSTTMHADSIYVAVAYGTAGVAGVVRVATTLAEVETTVGHLRVLLLLGGVVGMILAVVFSGLASRMFAAHLERLLERTRSEGGRANGPDPDGPLGRGGGGGHSIAGLEGQLASAIERLASERDRLQTILDSMEEGVFALDQDDRIGLANGAACAMAGVASSLHGKKLSDVLPVPALIDVVHRAEHDASTQEFELPGPPPRCVLARVAPLRASGGRVFVLHDVTETRRLETVRRDFVANVSHELRTPVSIIRAHAETLLDGALLQPEHAHNFVDVISRNAERLTSLIGDLLDLSRIEAGRSVLDLQAINLDQPLRRAIAAMCERAREKDTTLVVEVVAAGDGEARPERLQVRADADACEQVVLNLVENAIKYTPAGSHIAARLRRVGEVVRVEIEDDGPGLPLRHRERIFERFYRADPGRSRQMGGTGLGLSIVKHLVESMGGQVGFEPAPSGGAVFWFALPAVTGVPRPARIASDPPVGDQAWSWPIQVGTIQLRSTGELVPTGAEFSHVAATRRVFRCAR